MPQYTIEDIYLTLCGELENEHAVPGVANAYADGSECDKLYCEMYAAYLRLLDRLGMVDEDSDLEIIIGNMLSIQEILCEKMFLYGMLSR